MKADGEEFSIHIQYDRMDKSPERIFMGIAGIIESFKGIDNELVRCIDSDIESVLLLEDVESGSILLRLKNVVENIPDDALKSGDYKRLVGEYLCRAKYKILEFISRHDTISTEQEARDLESEIKDLAESTEVNALGCYSCPTRHSFMDALYNMSIAMNNFHERDSVSMELGKDSRVLVNKDFSLTKEQILDLCKGDTLENDMEILLQVRRPDFLGNMQWEFRHGENKIVAKIKDHEWMERFRSHQFNVSPGDSLKVKMHSVLTYGKSSELLDEKNTITEVLDVVHTDFYRENLLWDE